MIQNSIKSLEESLEPFENHPTIKNQFEYIEVSAVKENGLYRVIYTFVKPDHTSKTVRASCNIHTGIVGRSISECALIVNKVMQLSIFNLPVIAKGTLFDQNMNALDDIDWNSTLKEAIEFLDPSEEEIVYH